jgi:protein TonB
MSHTATASSFRQAQLGALQMGVLRERPSPARIAAYAAVIALHAAAIVLLLMPVAPPDRTASEIEVIQPIWLKPNVKPVEPPPLPPPPDRRRLPRDTTPRNVVIPVEQPPIVIDEGPDVAPPPDPNPDTATRIESVEPVGPIAAGSLDYVIASPPPYPREAMARRIEGTVVLEVLVDVDGTPLDVRVQTSSGNRALDDAARKHILKKWKFKPATQNGHAVQAVGLVPVKFTLR